MLTGLHNIDDSFGDYFIYRIGTGFQMKGFERGFIRLGHNFDLVGTKCRVFDQPEDRIAPNQLEINATGSVDPQ